MVTERTESYDVEFFGEVDFVFEGGEGVEVFWSRDSQGDGGVCIGH